jgi:hypothetical protein
VAVVQLLLEAWGQHPTSTAELVQAAYVAAGWERMPSSVRLVKALRKRFPEFLPKLFEHHGEDPIFVAAAVAAAVEGWTSEVSKKDEQRAAVREREEAVAREQQVLQQLVVHVAGLAKETMRHV